MSDVDTKADNLVRAIGQIGRGNHPLMLALLQIIKDSDFADRINDCSDGNVRMELQGIPEDIIDEMLQTIAEMK